ncbi:MAG: hydroxymethylglutaryl-CoA synthase [Anaerolineales bacterium]|nr:hydroxymethylglutaryl-CoA synthase [Anaerolineales bacterium]
MKTGIISYGVAIPKYRIEAMEIWKVWKNLASSFFDVLSIGERGVLGPEEDTLTLAVSAAKQAIERSGLETDRLDALLLGSGTSPYATKAAATIMVDALGLPNNVLAADVQCADKSGSTALWLAAGMIESGQIDYALVVGADTMNRHTQPGMVLEYVASAAAVAFVLGRENPIATLEAVATHAHDQNDYFRLEGERFIQPGAGFVGWVSNWGLLDHVVPAGQALFAKMGLKPDDFSKFAVPQKNGFRPLLTMGKLELDMMQVLPYVLTPQIGDCGAAGVPLSLAHILDFAEPGERIGVIDYGAGAGCDAWSLVCTAAIDERRPQSGLVIQQLDDKIMVDYATMCKFEQKYIQSPHRLSNFY